MARNKESHDTKVNEISAEEWEALGMIALYNENIVRSNCGIMTRLVSYICIPKGRSEFAIYRSKEI